MIAKPLSQPRRLPAPEVKAGPNRITIESPMVTVEAPKVDVYPQINVTPAQLHVQAIPAPKVEFSHKPCSWVFDIERDNEGSISRIHATPQ